MPILRIDDLELELDDWMDDVERRVRFFGWSDAQVVRLWLACCREMAERGIALQPSLFD
jgi:hypothetical protein